MAKKRAKKEPVEVQILEQPVIDQDNPDFEQLTDTTAAPIGAAAEAEEQSKRGGWRPGAGRPKGSTAELCAVKSLPEQPNEAVKASLEALFSLWALKSGVDAVKLTKDEAVSIALPVTQILELNGLGIPQSAHVYIMGVWSVWEVTETKIKLIREARPKEQQEEQPKKEAV